MPDLLKMVHDHIDPQQQREQHRKLAHGLLSHDLDPPLASWTPLPHELNAKKQKIQTTFDNLTDQQIIYMLQDCLYNEDEVILRLITQSDYLEHVQRATFMQEDTDVVFEPDQLSPPPPSAVLAPCLPPLSAMGLMAQPLIASTSALLSPSPSITPLTSDFMQPTAPLLPALASISMATIGINPATITSSSSSSNDAKDANDNVNTTTANTKNTTITVNTSDAPPIPGVTPMPCVTTPSTPVPTLTPLNPLAPLAAKAPCVAPGPDGKNQPVHLPISPMNMLNRTHPAMPMPYPMLSPSPMLGAAPTKPKRKYTKRKHLLNASPHPATLSNPTTPVPTYTTYSPETKRRIRSVGRLPLDDALRQVQNHDTNEDPMRAFQGWSEARVRAFRMIESNPNTYYYRFNAPGEEQAKGAWTDSEKALFMDRLKDQGPKPQWGIFSMAIPGRVGYQCSNYYRFLIETGEINDSNYVLDERGKARYLFDKKTPYGTVEKAVRTHSKHTMRGTGVELPLHPATKANKKKKKKKRRYLDNDGDSDDDDDDYSYKPRPSRRRRP
ncbi:hypothetical protein BC940DRAFT_311037 [Gongronella butleri]|nr:hypothetical protein BC940DRAFT_311037 [Gongronella butleri]